MMQTAQTAVAHTIPEPAEAAELPNFHPMFPTQPHLNRLMTLGMPQHAFFQQYHHLLLGIAGHHGAHAESLVHAVQVP